MPCDCLKSLGATASPPSSDWRKSTIHGFRRKRKPNGYKKSSVWIDLAALTGIREDRRIG
jgi:hypothetical protein